MNLHINKRKNDYPSSYTAESSIHLNNYKILLQRLEASQFRTWLVVTKISDKDLLFRSEIANSLGLIIQK